MAADLDITIQLCLHPLAAWYGVTRLVKGVDGQKLLVEIPAGVQDQMKLRLARAGRKRGEQQGDLYVEIKIEQPKFFFLQKCVIALVSITLGSLLISQLSGSILWDVWLVFGCLLVTLGILMLCGMVQKEYSGKREMSLGAFIFLSIFPALLVNGFEFDIEFTWTAAFACATIGGIIGSLSLQSKPKLQSLLAGSVAGNTMFGVIYYYTKHRETVWSYEIALLLVFGLLVALGFHWLFKKIF